ncbi:MAG: S-layer homology domain-containing protein [Clostridia bacterium]|nr:S-layer homology domain-containing protein [Clostridia bacterium]
MKKRVFRKLLACGLGVLMMSAMSLSASAVSISDYNDVNGHWCYKNLERAVNEGILNGSDSKLTPDRPVTGAEMAVMLVRAQNLQFYTRGYTGTDEDAWYYRYAAIAAEAGFLPEDGSIAMNQYVTRQQVFKAFVDAYGFETSNINPSDYLDRFYDTGAMEGDYAVAAAKLVEMGVITGDEWSQLRPFGNITRAEFIKILYTLEDIQSSTEPAETEEPAEQAEPAETQQPAEQAGPAEATKPVEQAGNTDETAAQGTDGKADADSGSGNDADADGKSGADGTGETAPAESGDADPAEPAGNTEDGQADTDGSEDQTGNSGTDTSTGTQTGQLWDGSRVRYTLKNAVIKINVHPMTEGSPVDADVIVENVDTPVTCYAEWFYDNAVADGYTSSDKLITSGTTSTFHRKLIYTKDMALTHSLGFELSVSDPSTGETYHLFAQAPVTVINYKPSHYATSTGAKTVSYGVSCVYNGNYTTSYNIDYSTETKTNFVNGNGYGSKTGYLLWANLHTQKVNVFTGSKGNWSLVKTMRIGSGAPGTSTPTGVTYITRKESAGWTTSKYTVKPVMRFYPGTGYAFHSVLFYPNSTKIKDGRVGFPISHGCLRMLPADIQWLYNNVPVNTTVVIY